MAESVSFQDRFAIVECKCGYSLAMRIDILERARIGARIACPGVRYDACDVWVKARAVVEAVRNGYATMDDVRRVESTMKAEYVGNKELPVGDRDR